MSRLPWYHIITRRLAEPAVITALQVGSYIASGAAGSLVVFGALPYLFAGAVSPWVAFVVGMILGTGSIIGAISCFKGVWWLERVALLLVGLGWILLVPSVVTVNQFPLLVKTFVLLLIVIAVFDIGKRYRRIDWAYLDPTK